MTIRTGQRELLRGAASAFATKVLAASANFLLSMVLARILGADGTGIYFLAFTVATIATALARAGMDSALVRFVAAYASTRDWGAVRGIYRRAMWTVLGTSTVTAIALYVLAPTIALGLFGKVELTEPLRWMAIALVPTTLFMLQASALQGLKRVVMSASTLSLFAPLFTLLTIPVIVPYHGVSGATISYLIAATLTLAIGLFFWIHSTPEVRQHPPHYALESFWRAVPSFLLVGILQQLTFWMSTLLVGALSTAREVAVFSVASRTSNLALFIMFAVNSVSAPKFSALYRAADLPALETFAQRATLLMVCATGAVLFLFLVFADNIMALFGQEFAEGGRVLEVLTVGIFLAVSFGSVGHILLMCGGEKSLRGALLLATVVGICANFALIPKWGAQGAAAASLITYLTQAVASAVAVRRRLNIAPWAFWRAL